MRCVHCFRCVYFISMSKAARTATRTRIKGDAMRKRWKLALEDAVQTRFGRDSEKRRKMLESARKYLVKRQCDEDIKLPFVDEFSGYPLRTQSMMAGIGRPRHVGWEHTIRFFGKLPKDRITPSSFDSDDDDDPSVKATNALVAQMARIVDNLNSACDESLKVFCARELDALRVARDACVERMLKWDAQDVDVDALCTFDAE